MVALDVEQQDIDAAKEARKQGYSYRAPQSCAIAQCLMRNHPGWTPSVGNGAADIMRWNDQKRQDDMLTFTPVEGDEKSKMVRFIDAFDSMEMDVSPIRLLMWKTDLETDPKDEEEAINAYRQGHQDQGQGGVQ